ncbi:U-box domain-containing protein 1 [Rhynchospora pubera]|uniref:E3 ubiquitin-protein ligase CHIP n=1 Tax=Rhynchospora pubera TaxID=906938 RepID=A0AAV8BZK6_9POAL|nr:U-box domain-containing protein 1 [Rhynchospora pubera]
MVKSEMERQAQMRKEVGNACFRKDKLGAAIDSYTEAIALQPNVAVYWTNRALCFRKRKEWTRVEEDCKRALQLDRNSHKAHYMLGLALLEKEDYVGAISELGKAWDILRSIYPHNEKADEIWRVLAKAKFLEWELTSSEHQWRLQNLKELCENAIREYNFLHEESGDTAPNHLAEQLQLLNEVFEKASEADVSTDVPDYLCCKITFDIFTDPVLTPSGITYERSALLEHLRTVGDFDPITRKPLKESQLIPNLAIKGAVQAYLKEHGWAYNMG